MHSITFLACFSLQGRFVRWKTIFAHSYFCDKKKTQPPFFHGKCFWWNQKASSYFYTFPRRKAYSSNVENRKHLKKYPNFPHFFSAEMRLDSFSWADPESRARDLDSLSVARTGFDSAGAKVKSLHSLGNGRRDKEEMVLGNGQKDRRLNTPLAPFLSHT